MENTSVLHGRDERMRSNRCRLPTRGGRILRLALVLTLMFHVGLAAPHAAWAQDLIRMGGEWSLLLDGTRVGTAERLQASTALRLQGRTLTHPWRIFFDGRVIGSGSTEQDFSAEARLDRLYLRLYLPGADVTVGKQTVNWGSGYAWSPTDVFNPPDPHDPTGVRKGVTSVVLQAPVGPLDYWSVAFASEQAGVRRRGNVSGVDWSLLAALDRGDVVLGGDLKGDRGIGWRIAGAYRLPDEAGAARSMQVVFGADYSWFSGRLHWIGEYMMDRGTAGPGADRTFHQVAYQIDEFSSVSAALLADLTARQSAWTLGAATALGGQSKVALALTLFGHPGALLPSPAADARATLEYTLAF